LPDRVARPAELRQQLHDRDVSGLGERIDLHARAGVGQCLLGAAREPLDERLQDCAAQAPRSLPFGDAPLVVAVALRQIEPFE